MFSELEGCFPETQIKDEFERAKRSIDPSADYNIFTLHQTLDKIPARDQRPSLISTGRLRILDGRILPAVIIPSGEFYGLKSSDIAA